MNLLNPLRRVRRALLPAVAALLVAACGGGVSSEEFDPVRVLVFGDEASVLDDSASAGNARKYTVNALDEDDDTKVDCNSNRIWVQSLAAAFGHVFPQCNPNNTADLPSRNYAAAGARVADVAAQITTHLAGGSGFKGDDLVTVHVGTHDILDAYAKYPLSSRADLIAEVEARGEALGQQVRRIADAGGKVLIVTVPDIGRTPFGRAEETAVAGRADLLSKLAERFNAKLRTTLPDDGGRSIGLVLYNELVDALLKDTSTSFDNKIAAACDPAEAPVLLNCTPDTLVEEDADTDYMWADGLWPAPGLQSRLGTLATNQARRNPF